jgi:hypothetical protein
MKVVYCGGCNPHIDRTAVAEALSADPEASAEATVYLSGCPRACASRHCLTTDDPATILVAGELVDGTPTRAAEIAAVVRAHVEGALNGLEIGV